MSAFKKVQKSKRAVKKTNYGRESKLNRNLRNFTSEIKSKFT